MHGTSDAGYDVRLIATGHAPANATFPVVAYRRSDRRLTRMSLGVARAVFRASSCDRRSCILHDPELIAAVPLFRLFGVKVVFDAHEHIAASMANKTILAGGSPPNRPSRGRWTGLAGRPNSLGIVTATPAIAADFHNERTAVIQNSPILAQWARSRCGAAIGGSAGVHRRHLRGSRGLPDA